MRPFWMAQHSCPENFSLQLPHRSSVWQHSGPENRDCCFKDLHFSVQTVAYFGVLCTSHTLLKD